MDVSAELRRIVEGMDLDPKKLWVPTNGDNGVVYEGTCETQLAAKMAAKALTRETLQDLFWNLPLTADTCESLADELRATGSRDEDDDEEEVEQTPITPRDIMILVVEDAILDTITEMFPPPTN